MFRPVPIGSRAIKNDLRRVVNLRVNNNAASWLRANAQTIICFGSWIKAGRAEERAHQTTYVTSELVI